MSRRFWPSVAVLVAVGIGAACTEKFPRQDVRVSPPAPAEPAIGLDQRPVSGTCFARARPTTQPKVGFQKLGAPAFEKPVEIVAQGGRLYVLEQAGLLRAIAADDKTVSTVADLRPLVGATGQGESGLLGLAFHPKFADNGFVYVYYTAPFPPPAPAGLAFQSVLARFESKDGGATLDLATEKHILVIDQPYSNHNGGTIAFGNDGLLYWGLGDGGNSADPQNRGQDTGSPFGKMLRIDVDGGDPYAIPPSNPFAGGGGLPEIYALGFRNPYRWRFDRATGDLWVGDVGQSTREEIDRVVLGGNYGWRIREGKTCFNPNPCDPTGLIDPVVDHGRSEAQAITGGVVYRGKALPELDGFYVYSDIGSAIWFAFPATDPNPTPIRLAEGLDRIDPSAISLDDSGEIVVAEYSSGNIWRMVPPSPPAEMPARLSGTGCLDTAGTFPYDVIVPQWLDGRSAERFLSIPESAHATVTAGGRLVLPPGSIAMRTIEDGARKVETQLLVVRPDGEKGAYTYVWADDQKDAVLDPQASTTCTTCHEDSRGTFVIGLETVQLDRDFAFPGGKTGNVLATLGKVGMLAAPLDPSTVDELAALDSQAPVAHRAQSYLHANCTYCHAAPLDTCASVARMKLTGPGRMPPLGSTTPHAAAIAVIDEWARSTSPCP